jgi:YD repeat-containing protein
LHNFIRYSRLLIVVILLNGLVVSNVSANIKDQNEGAYIKPLIEEFSQVKDSDFGSDYQEIPESDISYEFAQNHLQEGAVELVDKRTDNKRYFLNKDKTITLVGSEKGSRTQKNKMDIKKQSSFPFQNNNTDLKDSNIKGFFGGNSIDPYSFSLGDTTIIFKALEVNSVSSILDEDKIIFPNIWNKTTMQYEMNSQGAKFELLLQDNTAPKSFTYEIEIPSELKPIIQKDNSVVFADQDGNGEIVIPSMWVQDSSSKDLRYDRIYLTIKEDLNQTQNNKTKTSRYYLTITLTDDSLQYPLIIDPSIDVYGSFDPVPDGTTQVYIDLPDIYADQIEYVTIEFDGPVSNYGREVSAYLTVQEYGTQFCGPNSPIGCGGNDNGLVLLGTGSYGSGNGGDGYAWVYVTKEDLPVAKDTKIYGVAGIDFGYIPNFSYWITYNSISTIDTEAPSVPTQVKIIANTNNSMTLSWYPSTDNVGIDKYEVFNGSSLVGEVNANTTSFLVTGLSENVTYSFTVIAVDKNGNKSNKSEVVSGMIDLEAPSTPSNFKIQKNLPPYYTNLSWTKSTDNVGVTAYEVYHNSTKLIATLPADLEWFTLAGNYGLYDAPQKFSIIALDAMGNRSAPCEITVYFGKRKYNYDALGRLINVTDENTNTSLTTYTYDKNGNLVKVSN